MRIDALSATADIGPLAAAKFVMNVGCRDGASVCAFAKQRISDGLDSMAKLDWLNVCRNISLSKTSFIELKSYANIIQIAGSGNGKISGIKI